MIATNYHNRASPPNLTDTHSGNNTLESQKNNNNLLTLQDYQMIQGRNDTVKRS